MSVNTESSGSFLRKLHKLEATMEASDRMRHPLTIGVRETPCLRRI